jgi:RNA polymerase sigma-70 factor (sigma-E family)
MGPQSLAGLSEEVRGGRGVGRSRGARGVASRAGGVTRGAGSVADAVTREAPLRALQGHSEGSLTQAGGPWSERDECVARLFDEHYRGLCRLAGILLSDSVGAEEVVQEAFLKTFSGWWRVRHPERAQWYLRTSVVNLCRSRLRRRWTEERGNRTWSATDLSPDADESEKSDESLFLRRLVRDLPPRQREAVVLRYYEDLSEAEIARTLGCAVGTVKSQLAKARRSLSKALEDSGSSGSGPGSSSGLGPASGRSSESG